MSSAARFFFAFTTAALALAAPATADFTAAQLHAISASSPPHAALPLDMGFLDGRRTSDDARERHRRCAGLDDLRRHATPFADPSLPSARCRLWSRSASTLDGVGRFLGRGRR